jgi:transcription antitermination factor NusG
MDNFSEGDRVRINSGEYEGKTGTVTDIEQYDQTQEVPATDSVVREIDTRIEVTLDDSGDKVILYGGRMIDKI